MFVWIEEFVSIVLKNIITCMIPCRIDILLCANVDIIQKDHHIYIYMYIYIEYCHKTMYMKVCIYIYIYIYIYIPTNKHCIC